MEENNLESEKTIYRSKLILAEGRDDERFLYHLLCKNGIDGIQIRTFNGVKNLTNDLKALLLTEGFEDVVSLLIFRDSEVKDQEKSTQTAIQSVNSSLHKAGLITTDLKPFEMSYQNNRNIGFGLFPGLDENGELFNSGTLENLCLSVFKENSNNLIVKTYISDFQKNTKIFKRPHKNELHALFSFSDGYVGDKIGEAARDGCFNFSSPYLFPFLEMIKKL